MDEKSIILPDSFPLVVLNPQDMILPSVIWPIEMREYPSLLVEARAGKLPYVFTVMSVPALPDTPDEVGEKLFDTGVVASIQGANDIDPLILLKGEYRAKLIKVERANPEADHLTAFIGETVGDNAEAAFVKKDGELVVNEAMVNAVRGFLYRISEQIEELVVEHEDFLGPKGALLAELGGVLAKDGFNKFYRENIDEYIWNVVFALPYMEAHLKQRFLGDRSLWRRILACISLFNINIDVARVDKKVRMTGEAVRGKVRRLPVKSKSKPSPGDSAGNAVSDDDQFDFSDPDLKAKYQKYLEKKQSIKDDEERSIFIQAATKDFKTLMSFEKTGGNGSGTEVTMINNRLDLILSLPWGKESPIVRGLNELEATVDSEHYGLEKTKEEVSEFLAVQIHHPGGRARILCFVGPPGVGKTSFCKSIAHGLGLEYVRISLGGIRDEADIRGHRVTYIGARPGRIIDGLKSAGFKNIVFVLDEIDKIGSDTFRGDPSTALLEVLDPEQNRSFTDHYLDAPFDLSRVLFICTANTVEGILPALRDRMDIIPFSGYTEEEKIQIAKRFLVPKVFAEVGLTPIDFKEDILSKITRGYTKESGVRDLERKLAKIARRIVKDNLKNPDYTEKLVISEELVEKIHGQPRLRGRIRKTKVGAAIGLYVNEVGDGDITYVQAQLSIKTGIIDKSISQTDKAGEDLHKSNQRAVDVVKSKIENIPNIVKKLKTHLIVIQVSDDFSPVDGPSAGVAVVVAIYSKLTGQVVKPYIAMTGAIALLGEVKEVGGIKDKVIAAVNAGAKEIILPESNRKTYNEKVPQSTKSKLDQVYFVEDIDQVLEIVFPEDKFRKQPQNPA